MATASATPAATIQPVASSRAPARTTHHAATATSSTLNASYVANDPRCNVGPSTANNAAEKNAARRPNNRPAVPHTSAVAPSMNTSDSTRAPASPPTLSASAPNGG